MPWLLISEPTGTPARSAFRHWGSMFPTSALPDGQGKQLPLLLKSLGVKTVAITTAQHPFSLENKKFIVEAMEITPEQYKARAKNGVVVRNV